MKKYNVFCEIKISNIILIILGISLCVMSLIIDEKFHYTYLILTILLIIIFIRDFRKYLNLKKYGKIIKNANYMITSQNGRKVLKLMYTDNNIDYELYGKLTSKFKSKSGKTNILINKKDPNEFYAFGPFRITFTVFCVTFYCSKSFS